MKPDLETSGFDFWAESLERIWKPGMEAVKLQLNSDIRSLDDIPRAAEGAGCEISYVDLPEKISGFAQVIDGHSHIVVNRAKSSKHSEFTIAHELGHHVLHSNPSQDGDQANCLTASNVEFEANLFGATLVTAVTTEEERKEMVRHNPEIHSTLAVSVFGMVLAIVMALAIWICSVFPSAGCCLDGNKVKPAATICGLYTRVSSRTRPTPTFSSLETQRERLEAYCQSQENYSVYRVYEDGGYSADSLDRPALKEMLRDVREERRNPSNGKLAKSRNG